MVMMSIASVTRWRIRARSAPHSAVGGRQIARLIGIHVAKSINRFETVRKPALRFFLHRARYLPRSNSVFGYRSQPWLRLKIRLAITEGNSLTVEVEQRDNAPF